MASNVEKNYQERILNVLIYIQNHLDNALTLEELSAVAYFSPFHFHRIFTAHTGESIQSYVKRLRLERATRDLSFTDLSLVQVAERAGYDTQQSFHRAFKEMYQETPKSFRDKISQQIEKISSERKTENKTQLVEVKKINPIQVAFVRHVGSYTGIMETWLQLTASVGMPHVLSDNTIKISIPYDSQETTPTEKLRYDACVTLEGLADFKPKGNVGIQTLHGGKYAIITHHGPIEQIESTYQILFGLWLPQSGYEPADHPNFMLHRTIPYKTPAELLMTDIYLPVK